jgi:demethylspheroidene O-methyltransferase
VTLSAVGLRPRRRWFAGDWRARLIADPRFQRWAARFWLTRPIARARARALFDISAGFVYSQILAACVRLEVFERLAKGPRETADLAADIGLSPEAARRLLKGAAALGLLRERRGDRFGLADLGAAVLGNPGVSAMVAHHALLYDDLADPVALLRAGAGEKLPGFWAYGASGPAAASYSELMAASQALIAQDVLSAHDFRDARALLDVGGGEGAFLSAVARVSPGLKLGLFDLPPVVERAGARFAATGLAERVSRFGGDFLNDDLPSGFDAISLIRVLHDHDDAPAHALLKRAFAALPAGGSLLVAEPMSGVRGAEPVGDAYFGFYLLAMGRGRPRRASEIAEMLRAAGFSRVRALATFRPAVVSALLAQKP